MFYRLQMQNSYSRSVLIYSKSNCSCVSLFTANWRWWGRWRRYQSGRERPLTRHLCTTSDAAIDCLGVNEWPSRWKLCLQLSNAPSPDRFKTSPWCSAWWMATQTDSNNDCLHAGSLFSFMPRKSLNSEERLCDPPRLHTGRSDWLKGIVYSNIDAGGGAEVVTVTEVHVQQSVDGGSQETDHS